MAERDDKQKATGSNNRVKRIAKDLARVRRADQKRRTGKGGGKEFNWKIWTGGGTVLVLLMLALISPSPQEGTMRYGLCKVFLELQLYHPETLNIASVSESPKGARIRYSHVTAGGDLKLGMIDCTYEMDSVRGIRLTQASIDRQPLPKETVNKFNTGISSIMAEENRPDLTYPPPLTGELTKLKQ